jgi:hypothetical protein
MAAKIIIRCMLVALCILFVLFESFNDNPYERKFGGMTYPGFVSLVGIVLCAGATYWLNQRGGREE